MTELEVYQPKGTALAVPESHDIDSWIAVVQDVIKVANVIYDTPFVPDGLRGSAPATAAAILAGREMGLGPMTSLQHIHVIKGKPGQSALLMRALIIAAGHDWDDVDISDTRVVVRGKRKGESKWTEASFTRDQAKIAGIDLGRYPQDKLYARATVRLARRKFADVIMGMPYSAEELEDGETGEGVITETAASNGHAEPAKPAGRTAQRRTWASADRPTTAAPAAATAPTTAPATAQTAPSDPALPPLPGEDEDPTDGPQPGTGSSPSESATGDGERDYDSPGTVTTPQLTATWTVLKNVFGFTAEEKDQARAVAAYIVGHPLASSRDMSHNEARTVLDTLGNWQATATERGETPRGLLIAYMAAAAGQDASGEPEPGDG